MRTFKNLLGKFSDLNMGFSQVHQRITSIDLNRSNDELSGPTTQPCFPMLYSLHYTNQEMDTSY